MMTAIGHIVDPPPTHYRAALAMELVEAHTEEAAKARQESALNAAKFRRVSRVADQAAVAAAVASAGADTTAPEKSPKGKSPSAANRYVQKMKVENGRRLNEIIGADWSILSTFLVSL